MEILLSLSLITSLIITVFYYTKINSKSKSIHKLTIIFLALLVLISATSCDSVKTKISKAKSSKDTTASSEANSHDSSINSMFAKDEKQFSANIIQELYQKDMKYVELNHKIFSSDYYKLTLNTSNYIYFGDLKDNLPNGKGILLTETYSDSTKHMFTLIYIGNFKDGRYNGFGIKFKEAAKDDLVTFINDSLALKFQQLGIMYKQSEGYFKDGSLNGKGNNFILDKNIIDNYLNTNDSLINTFKNTWDNGNDTIVISKLPLIESILNYQGDFSKDDFNGSGKLYRTNGSLLYNGKFKNGQYDGKGKLYNNNGKLLYDGEFKEGKYYGKGILYSDDGSVKYKGNFENGSVK